MQVVILAAGKGSRLHPLTLERSKAMMPVAGKPMIARVMEMFNQSGLEQFIVVAHPEDHELNQYFSRDNHVVITHQAERKGAAHALQCAAPFINSDFILSACDNLVAQAEAFAFVQQFTNLCIQGQTGLLALIRVPLEKIQAMGMVDWDGEKIQRIVEKPSPDATISNIASIPLYGFSLHFLDFLHRVKPSKRGELELQDAMQMMIAETNGIHGKMLSGRLTVTDTRDLLALNLHYLHQQQNAIDNLPGGVTFIQPCLIEKDSIFSDGCIIGPNVLVEAGAKIGKGAIVKNAVILRGANVPDGEIVENLVYG